MDRAQIADRLDKVLADIVERSAMTERFLDRDHYRIYVTTLWANLVLNPEDVGFAMDDLEAVHDYLNQHIVRSIGDGESLTTCFRFIASSAGERALSAARVGQNHQDLLKYFSSMILDPEGHKRWMNHVCEPRS